MDYLRVGKVLDVKEVIEDFVPRHSVQACIHVSTLPLSLPLLRIILVSKVHSGLSILRI